MSVERDQWPDHRMQDGWRLIKIKYTSTHASLSPPSTDGHDDASRTFLFTKINVAGVLLSNYFLSYLSLSHTHTGPTLTSRMVWFSSRLQEKEWWGGGSAGHHFTTEFLALGLCMGLCKVPLCIGIRGTLHATMDIPEKGGRMSVGVDILG